MQQVSTNGRLRVLIIDDHPVVREGIGQIVRQAGGLEVCGEADCQEKALQAVSASKPDVAVVDLALAAGSGLGLIRELKEWHPNLPLLVLSGRGNEARELLDRLREAFGRENLYVELTDDRCAGSRRRLGRTHRRCG